MDNELRALEIKVLGKIVGCANSYGDLDECSGEISFTNISLNSEGVKLFGPIEYKDGVEVDLLLRYTENEYILSEVIAPDYTESTELRSGKIV